MYIERNRKNIRRERFVLHSVSSLSRALYTSFHLLRLVISNEAPAYQALKIPFTKALCHSPTFRTSLIELEVEEITRPL